MRVGVSWLAVLKPLWIEPAQALCFRDRGDAQLKRRHARTTLGGCREREDFIACSSHNFFEAIVDFVFRPEELHHSLHPLEIAHGDTTGVGKDVRYDENAFLVE